MGRRLREAFGWYGVAVILLAYALVSFDAIEVDSLAYQVMNLTGAFGIVAVSLVKRVFQSVVLNLVWAAIAAIAIIRVVV